MLTPTFLQTDGGQGRKAKIQEGFLETRRGFDTQEICGDSWRRQLDGCFQQIRQSHTYKYFLNNINSIVLVGLLKSISLKIRINFCD